MHNSPNPRQATRRVRAVIFAALIAFTALTVGALVTAGGASETGRAHDRGGQTTVKIEQGTVRGKTVSGTNQFLGLPFAAPPVADLRWRSPQPAAKWKGTRNATAIAPHCAQPGTPFGVESAAEDCLYLNVYAPKRLGNKTPVLVWIHGGGLRIGEAEDYDPTALAAAGTLVVTVNYRLGALGFLAHESLLQRPGDSTGAYGLEDQQAALKWVQRNIDQFGGDPKNVTIGGQSAGALAVLAHVTSQTSKGLFQKAIVETGAFALTQTPLKTAKADGAKFADAVGCTDQSAACLRSIPVDSVLTNQNNSPYGYVPGVIDGKVLKQSIGTALASGQFNRVPILNGTTRDESRLFVGIDELFGNPTTVENYTQRITETIGVDAATAAVVAATYPVGSYPSPGEALSALNTDAIFACPALQVDRWTTKHVPTFAYEFNDRNAPQRFLSNASFPYGAYHIAETQYLFDLPTAPVAGTLNARQQKLATSMKLAWASFIDNGSPNVRGQVDWPAFRASSQKILSLNPAGSTVQTSFEADHKCKFWIQG